MKFMDDPVDPVDVEVAFVVGGEFAESEAYSVVADVQSAIRQLISERWPTMKIVASQGNIAQPEEGDV